MSTRHVVAAAATLALAGGLTGSTLTGAHAATADRSQPTVKAIAKHLVGPLSVAQAPDGTRYWTDSFAGPLYKQAPGGQPTVVFPGSKKAAAEGVSADGGVLRFTTGDSRNKGGKVWTLDANGAPQLIGDTFAYEKQANPDGKFDYGFLNTPKSCLDRLPKSIPASYHGRKESHPYATATANGITYVADAGGNSILAISPTGTISTVAALKPVKVKATKSIVKSLGLPSCTLGKKYALEAVPTDVEVGPDGQLYVSSLVGGPEDGSLGLNSRILKIDPTTGKVSTVSEGYAGLTGVAVAPNGDIYAADLFMNTILTIPAGHKKPRTFVEVPFPAAVEVTPTGLLATANSVPMSKKPKGQVITVTP